MSLRQLNFFMTEVSVMYIWHAAYVTKPVIHMAWQKTASHLPHFIMIGGWDLLHGVLTMKSESLNWHWYWDTGNGDTGNTGPHQLDIARWGLKKNEHPVSVYSAGGFMGLKKQEPS